MANFKLIWFFFLLTIFLSSLAAGVGLYKLIDGPSASASDGSTVSLQPGEIRFVNDPFSGESLDVNLMLMNESGRSVTITNVSASCGCTSLLTTGGKPFSFPVTLNSGNSLPCLAQINTDSQAGPKAVVVTCELTDDGGHITLCRSRVSFNVRTPWVLAPQELFVKLSSNPGVTTEKNAVVGKALVWEDAGLPPLEDVVVSSSCPTKVFGELVSHSAASDHQICRRKLVVRLVDPANLFEDGATEIRETVCLSPKDKGMHKKICFPVTLRRILDYSLIPDRLTIRAASKAIERRIVCTVADEARNDLEILRVPDGVEAELKWLNKRLCQIDMIFRQGVKPVESEIVISFQGDKDVAFRVPITVLP